MEETESTQPQTQTAVTPQNILRLLLLAALTGVVGFLAWQPTRLRLSALVVFADPGKDTNLAWHPDEDPAEPLEPVRRQPPPAEWRLGSPRTANWQSNRSVAPLAGIQRGNLALSGWQRASDPHIWVWDDDSGHTRIRIPGEEHPPQKPASAYRVGDIAVWPETQNPEPVYHSLPRHQPPAPQAQTLLATATPTPSVSQPQEQTFASLRMPEEPLSAARTPAPQETAPSPASQSPRTEPEIDWKTHEITGPIEGAYLTIYPKLKFIGLCVPGQGYIRKYNQVGVPADLFAPKMSAQDGRTPYGRYYIADRYHDSDGARLFLSWPSPEDAQRIGLNPTRQTQVESAWRKMDLPPQDTEAGGGVGLNGLRNWVEVTEGGFSLEEPHMEEIYTALPEKAWVFIQE